MNSPLLDQFTGTQWANALHAACGFDALTDPIIWKPDQIESQIRHVRESEAFREKLRCIRLVCSLCKNGVVIDSKRPPYPTLHWHYVPNTGVGHVRCSASGIYESMKINLVDTTPEQTERWLKYLAERVKDPERNWKFLEIYEYLNRE